MDFNAYLTTLPPEQLTSLYDSPWTCQAVLRSLPPLAQHYVLQLLFLEQPIPASWLTSIVHEHKAKHSQHQIQLLSKLNVLHQSGGGANAAKTGTVQLEKTFQSNLQQSVVNPASLGHQATPVNDTQKDTAAAAVASVHAFGEAQWQAVLLAMVDGRRASLKVHAKLPPLNVKQLFEGAQLTDEAAELTDAGFKFLFLDVYSQLWQLLQRYLEQRSQGSGESLAHALSFLLQLSFRKASQPLAAQQLSEEQQTVAAHMCALGLMKPQEVAGEMLFCPTFLAGLLCGATAQAGSAVPSVGGFIVVETSFRLYAYTSSPVQIAILQLFVRTDCLLPNMFVGTLTAKSVTTALERGITAEMLIKYLEDHRHPKVAHRHPVVPEAITDQLLLWQGEMHRLSSDAAVLYDAFDTPALFEGTLAKAQELDAVLFCDRGLRRLVAAAHAHNALRAHIQALRQQAHAI